ncbi:TPA: hypothetical protein N0F65_009648 [Lagenidium giganteum]|uniref:Uncharacterized protein n=1 Tax=Lagenidium giganteum TaxID=4803 RepID=A0AAV2YGB1_9STRA|nr:TPA: hypothetical protein N0F65_009648 [Lagenidium giganteum]
MQPPESNVASDSLCNVFDLDELARIRPAPDGFRRVNVGCVFTPLSSSSSSSEEEEPLVPQLSSSSDDDSWIAPPVFVKGDRVLFKARQRRFRGKVRRRIRRSCFYDIKADNGSVFLAVAASNIKLLEDEAPAPLRRLAKHDRVLWIPAPASSPTALTTELSYKAKIVHCRPENRYDIGLRTGRVLTKIPREELFDRPA